MADPKADREKFQQEYLRLEGEAGQLRKRLEQITVRQHFLEGVIAYCNDLLQEPPPPPDEPKPNGPLASDEPPK